MSGRAIPHRSYGTKFHWSRVLRGIFSAVKPPALRMSECSEGNHRLFDHRFGQTFEHCGHALVIVRKSAAITRTCRVTERALRLSTT